MKITKDTKIQSGRFYESEIKKTFNGGVSIEVPEDILRHLKCKGSEIFFTVTNGVLQVTAQEPKAEIPLFNPDDFENARS